VNDAEIERDTKLAILETERVKLDAAKIDYRSKQVGVWGAVTTALAAIVAVVLNSHMKKDRPPPQPAPTIVVAPAPAAVCPALDPPRPPPRPRARTKR
jgi:hypothetical protein